MNHNKKGAGIMNRTFTIHGGNRKYEEISFLKGFSIITIVLMHLIQSNLFSDLPSWLFKASALGGSGVHIFFLCSGFGLWLSYSRKKTTYIEFLRKRFLKIYVPYIVIVFVAFILPNMVVFCGNRTGALLSHVFLYKMFIPQYEESFGFFWFLSTIFQLYFVFVPLCRLKERIGNYLFFLISVLISVVWWIVSVASGIEGERIWGSFFLQYLWEFSAGMVLADYLKKKDISIPILYMVIGSVVGIALEGFMASNEILKSFNDIPACIGYGLLALLLYRLKPIKRMGCVVSDFSYEWYLVHGLVFSIIFYYFHPSNIFWQLGVGLFAFLASAVLGFLYHKVIVFFKSRKGKT